MGVFPIVQMRASSSDEHAPIWCNGRGFAPVEAPLEFLIQSEVKVGELFHAILDRRNARPRDLWVRFISLEELGICEIVSASGWPGTHAKGINQEIDERAHLWCQVLACRVDRIDAEFYGPVLWQDFNQRARS